MSMVEQLAALEEYALELMNEHSVPGVSIGLIVDGEEHYVSLGVTSVLHPLPVTPETLFQIGSTTKSFVATLAMKLIQDGLLEMDAPIRKYIPDFQVQDQTTSEQATIKHLLTHTGGWLGDFDLDTGNDTNALEKYVKAMRDLPQISPLGEMATYSNSGFILLGRVLEVASGKSLDTLMREAVLEPLGLHDTVYWAHEAITKRVAIGHKQSEDDQTEVIAKWQMPRADQGDGSLVSSARDQLRYARFHMGQLGDDPLTAASRLAMQTPQQPFAPGVQIGLCWLMNDHLQSDGTTIRMVTHGGHVDGFLSEFWFLPEKNFAYTSLTNAENGAAFNRKIGVWILEHLLDVPPVQPVPIDLSTAQLERFVGWYSNDPEQAEGINITLTEQGLMLEVSMKSNGLEVPPSPIQPTSESFCAGFEGALTGLQIEFFDLGQAFGKIRSGGRIFARQTRLQDQG
jgi:CubicO group peptidase (beta-lactamase class C family)